MTATPLVTLLGGLAAYVAEHPDRAEHVLEQLGRMLGILRDGRLVSLAPRAFDVVDEMRDAERTREIPDAVATVDEAIELDSPDPADSLLDRGHG